MVRITTLAFGMGMLCLCLTGCGTIPSYEQLGNGYVEATYTRTSWEPPASRSELRYKKSWRTVKIWPDIGAAIVKSDVAVFSGYRAYDQPSPNEPKATESRLFAVKAPGLPLDVTDEVLWQWTQTSRENFTNVLARASFVRWEEKDNAVEFHFAVYHPPDWPSIVVRLDWNKISDVMREVKKNGVVRKDRVWGTKYIEKEFKPQPDAALSPATH